MPDEQPASDRPNRERVLKFGHVRYGPHEHKVLVYDVSRDGAHVRTDYIGQLGDWLEFKINDNVHRGQIRWVRERHMGIQFEDAVAAINHPPEELDRLVENFRRGED